MNNYSLNLLPKETRQMKFLVKQTILGDHLLILPDNVEMMLFMEGRTAWTYKYSPIKVKTNKKSKKAEFSISAKLKKEFHNFSKEHQFSFDVVCKFFLEDEKVKIITIKPILT